MKFLRLYREFVEVQDYVDVEKPDLSDTTIDDVLSDDFFKEDTGSYIDEKGIIHIKNWKVY